MVEAKLPRALLTTTGFGLTALISIQLGPDNFPAYPKALAFLYLALGSP